MDITIRPARLEDAESMAAMLNAIIREERYTIMDREYSPEEQADFIRSFPGRGLLHVAVEREGRVVGLQELFPVSPELPWFSHVGEIGTFVSLDAHRRGIGRRLCEVTFAAAREKGFRKISAMIRADNPLALAFYTCQGFRVIGTAYRHALVRGEYIDEVLAEKLLD